MVLVIGGMAVDEAPNDSRNLFHAAPHLKEAAAHFSSISPKIMPSQGLLYLHPREYAAVMPQDKYVTILGTDDCTTNLMIVLRHTGSGAFCLGCVDGADTVSGITPLIARIQELSLGYPEGRLELHLIGGFLDLRGFSERLVVYVLHAFQKEPVEVDLVLACVGDMNTIVRNELAWPIVYGIGVNVKTGEIFPATFPDKGPDMALRSTRQFTGNVQLMDLYDTSNGVLRVGPIHYPPSRGIELWLEQADDILVAHLSFAPEAELPNFPMKARSALKHIRDHPFPAITIFPDNRPRYFRKDEAGNWIQVRFC